jgi:hypothetical protein
MGQLAVASTSGLAFADTGSTPIKSAAGFKTPGRIFRFETGVIRKGLEELE